MYTLASLKIKSVVSYQEPMSRLKAAKERLSVYSYHQLTKPEFKDGHKW